MLVGFLVDDIFRGKVLSLRGRRARSLTLAGRLLRTIVVLRTDCATSMAMAMTAAMAAIFIGRRRGVF